MLYVVAERLIARPPSSVWTSLLDWKSVTTWLEGAVRVDAPHELQPGATVLVTWQPRGLASFLTSSVVTSVRPDEQLAAETRGGGRLSFDRIRLTANDDGTHVEWISEVLTRGGLSEFLTSPHHLFGVARRPSPLELAYERSLEAFARYVEASSRVPYR